MVSARLGAARPPVPGGDRDIGGYPTRQPAKAMLPGICADTHGKHGSNVGKDLQRTAGTQSIVLIPGKRFGQVEGLTASTPADHGASTSAGTRDNYVVIRAEQRWPASAQLDREHSRSALCWWRGPNNLWSTQNTCKVTASESLARRGCPGPNAGADQDRLGRRPRHFLRTGTGYRCCIGDLAHSRLTVTFRW